VLEPLTARGAERLARVPHPFLSSSETISVAGARRLAPDGTVTELRPDLAFVQTPEVLRGCEHYSELAELVLLYPRVRPGDRVEYVVVKDAGPTIPGEFTAFLPVADTWPIRSARREVLLPGPMVGRLRMVPLGLDAEPARDRADPRGYVSVGWELQDRAAVSLEASRAPVRQAGPGIWLSTLAGWDEVAAWYSGIVDPVPSGDPLLQELAAERTKGAHSRDEIVRALHRTVSREVDYVGIEFGMGRLAPRPPAQVWRSRFGDCKDQAQLLRTLLAARGVPSHLVLINTTHAGRIEPEAPDFRQFDHVVLAVPRDEGGYTFCDPAQAHLDAGKLTASCCGRQALVVRDDCAEMVRIPEAAPEQLRVRFEVELTPYGDVSGWVRIEADGHQGRLLIGKLSRGDRETSIARTASFIGRFFPAVEVVDLEREEGSERTYFAAYFTGRAETEWRGAKLFVPDGGLLLPSVGTCGTRQTAFHQPLGSSSVEIRYDVPEGWALRGDVPEALDRSCGAARAEAAWSCDTDECRGHLRFESRRTLVRPGRFGTFREIVQATRSWLDTPLHVGEGADVPAGAAKAEPAEPEVEMPRLPSGAGQLRLVDVQYPRNGDLARRREALECVRRWFVDDARTALQAGLEIAVIEQVDGKIDESLERIDRLMKRYARRAPRKLTAWAEYLRADGLRERGQPRRALQIYEALAEDPELSAHRRGWAYLAAARIRAEEDALAAVELLDEALRLDSPALADHVSFAVHLLCADSSPAVSRARLEVAAQMHPHRAGEVFERVIEDAAEHLRNGNLARAEALAEVVIPAVESDASLSDLHSRTACLGRSIAKTELCASLAERIGEHFRGQPPSWWNDVSIEAEKLGRDRLVLVLQQLDRSQQARRFVRGTVALITRWQVAPDFFGFLIWRCADQLERSGLSPGLARRFREWSESLPEGVRHAPDKSTQSKTPKGRRVPS
jgi:hypothetical protein